MASDATRLSEVNLDGQLRANLLLFDIVETNSRLMIRSSTLGKDILDIVGSSMNGGKYQYRISYLAMEPS